MSSLTDMLADLEVKVAALVQKKEELEVEMKALKAEKSKLQEQNEELSAKVEQLEEKNKILRIAGGGNEEGQREMKLKINEIVREVDKCIAQLNQ